MKNYFIVNNHYNINFSTLSINAQEKSLNIESSTISGMEKKLLETALWSS